ncbi:secretion protein HlyD [soil metagenome]
MNKLLKTALLALPLTAGGAWWVLHETPSAIAQPQITAHASTLLAPGRVEPLRDPVALAFESPGRIVSSDVDEGSDVTAGQVLARLDDRLAKARVASAEAQLDAAKARYLLARRGPRSEDISAARAEADAAAASAANRDAEQARSAKLGQTGALASSVVDSDQAAALVAKSQADAATARYHSLAKGTRPEQIEEASAAIELARAELDAAKVALDQTLLRAPSDGVILRRTAEVGALVTTMQIAPVVTFADVKQLELRAEVDEADIAAITVGMTAYATADAFGETQFPVTVKRITGELGRKTVRDDDPRARIDTRVLEVIVALPVDAKLPLGLRMSVHIKR